MRWQTIGACAVGVLLHPAWTAAQDRVRLGLDGVAQATTTDFEAIAGFTEFVEEGRVTGAHAVGTGPVYGGSLTIRLWKGLALGAGFSYFSKTGTSTFAGELPHPFLFNQRRAVSGTASGFTRREIGSHLVFGWIIPAGDRVEIVLSGGPSIFQVEQTLGTGVTYSHTYPYDEAQFTGVTTRRLKDRAVGFHTSGDVTWKFTKHVGIAGSVRFARATLDKTEGDSDDVSFDVGGLHAGGGIRFIF